MCRQGCDAVKDRQTAKEEGNMRGSCREVRGSWRLSWGLDIRLYKHLQGCASLDFICVIRFNVFRFDEPEGTQGH